MGPRRQRIACLTAALVLGLCGPAWGQGAGDEQYQDPFGDEDGQSEAPAQPEPEAEEPAPAATPPTAPPAQPAQTPPAPEGDGGGDQLPYTGAETGLIALAGAALLASGLALRRRSSSRADRA
jgi:LPXTG-motif cell wall-anchored protein